MSQNFKINRNFLSQKMLSNNLVSFFKQHGWILLYLFSCIVYSHVHILINHGDMLHYLGMSAYMKNSHQFLYPNDYAGHPYFEKPPLLFWLISLGWTITGINFWWPQFIICFWTASTILLTKKIFQQIMPYNQQGSTILPWVMASSLSCIVYLVQFRVDVMLVAANLIFISGFLSTIESTANQHPNIKNISLTIATMTLGIVLGLFSKGPVVFIWTMFPCLVLCAISRRHNQPVYYALIASIIAIFLVGLVWLIPILKWAPKSYWSSMLFGTIKEHLSWKSHSYLKMAYNFLPYFLLPWTLNILFVKKLYRSVKTIPHFKVLLCFFIPPILFFCYQGGLVWYVLPAAPIALIFITQLLTTPSNHKELNLFNSILFSLIFIGIASIIITKCYILPNNSPFLFHGTMNKPLFTLIAIICIISAFITIKYHRKFLENLPVIASIYFISYITLQSYGAKTLINRSHIPQMNTLLRQQIKVKQPIIYIDNPEQAGIIMSGIDLVDLKLKHNVKAISPNKITPYFLENPNAILLIKTNKSSTPCPSNLYSVLTEKANIAYPFYVTACKIKQKTV